MQNYDEPEIMVRNAYIGNVLYIHCNLYIYILVKKLLDKTADTDQWIFRLEALPPQLTIISCGVAPSFRFMAQNCQIDYESSIAQADHSPQRKSSVLLLLLFAKM